MSIRYFSLTPGSLRPKSRQRRDPDLGFDWTKPDTAGELLAHINALCGHPAAGLFVMVLRETIRDATNREYFKRQDAINFLESPRCTEICVALGLDVYDLRATVERLNRNSPVLNPPKPSKTPKPQKRSKPANSVTEADLVALLKSLAPRHSS